MEETKNLCAQIPISLHNKVKEGQAQTEKTLSEYITEVLTQYYEGGFKTMADTRTLAVQVSEELFQKLKKHLALEIQRTGRRITQKEFLIGLIEQALEEMDESEESDECAEDAEEPAEAE